MDPTVSSARKQIASWPSESPVGKSKNVKGGTVKLPEKYEMLAQFFNSLDTSIQLLRLKGSMSSFTKIRPQVESSTKRRFSYGHLAQLKFLLPEAIVIKKILTMDEQTDCMKPDLHVTLKEDAVKDDGKMKYGSGNSLLRKVFRSRLLDFFKAHPEGGEIPEETLPEPFNQSKQDLHSNTIKALDSSLFVETSTEALLEQQPVVASHLCRSFKRPFSQKVSSLEEENASQKFSTLEIASIQGTPAKITSTLTMLMTSTPALHSPKTCLMSPDDDSKRSPNKLARCLGPARSLKFDTPVKNAKVEDEVNETGCSSINSDVFDILPENLLQSIREKERKAIEEQDPAISQAKRERQIIASLPKLFNMILFLFRSIKRSVITKEELIYKIIASHCDVIDRREVEEQLIVLQELIPEWISEKLASSGDSLLCINKTSSPELIHARLAEAK